MSVVVEFTIPPEALPTGDALVDLSGVHVELERVVPAGETALPYLWVLGDGVDEYLERVESDPDVDDPKVLDRVEYGALVRATWIPKGTILPEIRAAEATILEATGTSEQWSFRIRTPGREQVSTLVEALDDHDIPVTIESIYSSSEIHGSEPYGLTPDQEMALLTAYREGYFETPRAVSQAELGDRFGITARAVSDRIRRGTRNLVDSTLHSSMARPDGGESE